MKSEVQDKYYEKDWIIQDKLKENKYKISVNYRKPGFSKIKSLN